jgi:hypothetical protein
MSFLSKISLSCFPWNRGHHEKLTIASWKASSSSASHDIFFLFWALWFTAVFLTASVPPACPQPNSDDAQIVYAFNIHFNIIPTYAHAFRISSSLQVYRPRRNLFISYVSHVKLHARTAPRRVSQICLLSRPVHVLFSFCIISHQHKYNEMHVSAHHQVLPHRLLKTNFGRQFFFFF